MNKFEQLQNGSDIRGIAMDGVQGESKNFGEIEAACIATAFSIWLGKRIRKNPFELKIVVGSDPRLSGEEIKTGIFKGLNVMGARGYDAGLTTTPAMYMACIWDYYDFDAAIMITASHLPWNRNGLKFFTASGGAGKSDIAEILKMASQYNFIGENSEHEEVNIMDFYAAHLRRLITQGLKDAGAENPKDVHIVVDSGNGSSGFFANQVLEPLGFNTTGSQYLELDGKFPNHPANPENKEAMESLKSAVLSHQADLGLIFDTDGDRLGAVSKDGTNLSSNSMIALAASIEEPRHPGGTVVTDSITSSGLHEFLEARLGLKHFRYKRGYNNVISKAKQLCEQGEDAFLAIETSGHAAFADNYFLDDGAYLACHLVVEAVLAKNEGQQITELIKSMKSASFAQELRYKTQDLSMHEKADEILTKLEEKFQSEEKFHLENPNYEGVRVNFEMDAHSGWFLLRKSLHDPVFVLNIESDSKETADAVLARIDDFLQKYEYRKI